MPVLHPKAKVMGDPLSDCSPLISAAASGKLRLVRLLVEGGAQVNGRNPRGETALLVACKTLRGEPAGPETVKLLTYLLQNKADPNAQDRAGRTALMYACMERAGVQVVSTLLSAGADPSMEDYSGASALVYAINTQHQPTVKILNGTPFSGTFKTSNWSNSTKYIHYLTSTHALQVLMDACRARGRDIIIIATEMGVNGGPVTRRYLNVPPSPDTSPVSCMSPSDIVLKTGSPNSSEGENIFNFRGTTQSRMAPKRCLTPGGSNSDKMTPKSCADKLPARPSPHSQLRRNTLPSVTVVPPLLHLPPLVNQSDSHLRVPTPISPSKSRSMVFLPHPPSSSPPSSSSRPSVRPALLSLLPLASSVTSLVAPPASCCSERRSLRRHSVQLEQIRGGGREQMNRFDL
eukprot:superscaffoldBa00003108_g16143